MKKFKNFVLAATIAAATISQAGVVYGAEAGFSDVPSSRYYAAPVAWAVEEGIAAGTSASTFNPTKACTRAEVVTFLYRANGGTPVSENAGFSDVKPGDYYYDAVNWAVSKGITSGIKEGTFAPDRPCFRAEAVTMMWRLAGSPKVSAPKFLSDVQESAYFYDAVNWAMEEGLTSGTSETLFGAYYHCIRADIVTFLYRQAGSPNVKVPYVPDKPASPAAQKPASNTPAAATTETEAGRTVLSGTIHKFTYDQLLAFQGRPDPNPGSAHYYPDGFVIIALDSPQSLSLKSVDGMDSRTVKLISIGTGYGKYDGKHVTISINPEKTYWPSDASLPLGQPRTTDVHVIG